MHYLITIYRAWPFRPHCIPPAHALPCRIMSRFVRLPCGLPGHES